MCVCVWSMGEGSQIQGGCGAVVGGVVWCVFGRGFADLGGGCRAGCCLRRRLRCAEVRVIFCPVPEVRIIFSSGAGSKNHLLV